MLNPFRKSARVLLGLAAAVALSLGAHAAGGAETGKVTGKVIGKDGRTAQSIRTLLSAAASKTGRRAHLDIVD